MPINRTSNKPIPGPARKAAPTAARRTGAAAARRPAAKQGPTLVGFTQLEVPHIELYETAVAFEPDCDPITAHERLQQVFGQKAGAGHFLFRADSSVAGRYWVRSTIPWSGKPSDALMLEPKRVVIQLAGGLMYHFSLPVCVGHEAYEAEEKVLRPYRTAAEFEAWFSANAANFGIKPLMFSASLRSLRFRHDGVPYRIDHAIVEGALEVAESERLRRCLQRGFGSHRRAGLGMLHLYN
jgi:hypothetical protein